VFDQRVEVNYTYSVEHNTGLFKIDLGLYMYTTRFGPFSGHHQACQYFLCEIFVWPAKGLRHVTYV
jgi:hypothetical protein